MQTSIIFSLPEIKTKITNSFVNILNACGATKQYK
jgi:hypothetical protein